MHLGLGKGQHLFVGFRRLKQFTSLQVLDICWAGTMHANDLGSH